MWCNKSTSSSTSQLLGLNKNTVDAYYLLLRQLCINKASFDPIMIGGENHVVELDETKVYHRKYNRGRLLFGERKKTWVIGGVDRNNGQCFAELVEKRDSNTIVNLIKKRFRPNTRLITDKWRAYLSLRHHGYSVDQVNHSKNFVDPLDSSVNTQRIERLWGTLKNTIPRTSKGFQRDTYIEEFVYRKLYFSNNAGDNLKQLLNDIKSFHPGCFLY